MKKIISTALISTALLGFGMSASAVEGVTSDENTKIVQSEATIAVKEGEDITPPVDPNEPDGPTDQKGPLSIDNVIIFAFQDMKLGGVTKNIPLKSTKEQNVQVTDTRGTGAGWNLKIKQSELVDNSDTSNPKTLKGAVIKLANPTLEAGPGNVDADKIPVSVTYAPTDKAQFASILKAEIGNGLATWLQYYRNTDGQGIELEVPSGNLKGNYKGSVTWQLTDGPNS